MKPFFITLLLFLTFCNIQGQNLPGFKVLPGKPEQQLVIENSPPSTRILINAPLTGFKKNDKVLLVFYALPNGNTIEQTFGKKINKGDDWHYDIQQIGAQTRFLRHLIKRETIVTVYLETRQKSWPEWVANTRDSVNAVKGIVDNIKAIFSQWDPHIILNGHSGGGRFIFSYLNSVEKIPDNVVRISFLDSNYGYEDSRYGLKLVHWLKSGKNNCLCTLAYNDSVAIYNGKPVVSPTGGTWYRTGLMQKYLAQSFHFKILGNDTLIWHSALSKRIEIILKSNPGNKIYHTIQVERNGFIHSMVSGTRYEKRGYEYFAKRAYSDYIGDSVLIPIRRLNIPVRKNDAETGTDFMRRIASLPLREREEEIYRSISTGNIPDFLRYTLTLKGEFADSEGKLHQIIYETMPDYLAIGNNHDYCRIPMNPFTAQKLADLFGGSLITSKLSDHIYQMAEKQLVPFYYKPEGNANELPGKFEEHNNQIENQLGESGGKNGQLVAGIKKDVILSSRLDSLPGKVVIYGWHKPDGNPVQPVYSGHVYWYVDYSHGIRLINNQVLVDGEPRLFSELLKDPVLYRIFSNEKTPMKNARYNYSH